MSAFVGRTKELAALAGLARSADAGPAAAVVVGDPGSGKTRLLGEAAAALSIRHRFRVHGYEPEERVPFAAAADLLRDLGEVPQVGRRLNALVFETPEEASGLEPVRVFEAAHRVLRSFDPALLVLDDLQWTDNLSLALCHYVVRAAQAAGHRLVFVAAARPGPEASSLAASLAQVLPAQRFTELELAPLGDADAIELLGRLAPTLDPASARRLCEKSGGSPFWLEALARSGGAEVDAGHLVTARLRGAGAEAASLLTLLAVAARPLALADVAELEGWPIEQAVHAADELAARGVVVRTGGGVRLAHDLIRAAALAETPDETRRDVHRRLAAWLERRAGDDLRALRSALEHRHAARLPSLALALRLARSPQRTLLGADGLALLGAIADEANPADETVLALSGEIAALASALGEHELALERRLLLAERRPEAMGRARALLEASRAALALDDQDAARRYLARARAERIADCLLGVELDTQEAAIEVWSDERREWARMRAHELVERARTLPQSSQTRRAYLGALRIEFDAAYQEDDPRGLALVAGELAETARGFDEEAHLAALVASARALRRLGRFSEAEERARSAWDEARRRVLPRLAIDAGYWLVSVLLQRARIGEAEEVVTDALEIAGRVGDEAAGRHPIARLACVVAYHRGDWRDALERLLEHAQTASEHARIEDHQDAALWLAFAGGPGASDEVSRHVSLAHEYAERVGCPRCRTELRLMTADAFAQLGRLEEAAQAGAEWDRLQRQPQPRDRIIRGRVEALVRHGGNAEPLDAVARVAEAQGLDLEALCTRIILGASLAAHDRERARHVLELAAATAAESGAVTEQQVAEQRLRALGVRTWRRGTAAGGLTYREREIVRLIAEGATNPEIAQRLFLSRKTVERHVSNLLKKVGVRNRAELAARVGELEVEGAHR